MGAEPFLVLTLSEARRIVTILESVVVSLDRIDEKTSSKAEADAAVVEFIGGPEMWRALSKARRDIFSAFDRLLSEKGILLPEEGRSLTDEEFLLLEEEEDRFLDGAVYWPEDPARLVDVFASIQDSPGGWIV